MKKELITTIEQRMLGILNNEQLAKLHEVLEFSLTMFSEKREETQHSNNKLLKLFLSVKQKVILDNIRRIISLHSLRMKIIL